MAKDRQIFYAEKIVLVGDGPAALILAIKLKQLGVKNVTIIGPRIGEYTRSGEFAAEVFDKVNEFIAPLSVKPSKGNHIKDLERGLYKHAEDLGVSFVHKKFVKFSDKNTIQVIDTKTNQPDFVATDLVVDCTGAKHAVLTQLNNEVPNFFKFDDNSHFYPHQYFALLRTKMDIPQIMAIQNQLNLNLNPVCYAIAMEKLHALGWESNAVPYVIANPEGLNLLDKVKVNFYFHVPKDFKDKDKIIEFANILLWLYQNNPSAPIPTLELHNESRKHPDKTIFSGFELHLHKTSPGCFMGNHTLPPVLHSGDATANLPFITGQSLMSAVPRMKALISQLTIEDGIIVSIDDKAYERLLDDELTKIVQILKYSGEKQEAWMNNWADPAAVIKTYEIALQKTNDAFQKQIIEDGLKRLSAQFAMQQFEKAMLHFEKNKHPDTGFKAYLFISQDIKLIFDYLAEAYKYRRNLTESQVNNLDTFALNFAASCKLFGTHFYKLEPPKYQASEKYYLQALKIYKQFLPDLLSEGVALYSNLLNVAYKQKNYNAVLEYLDQFNKELLPHLPRDEATQKVLDKIYYHAVLAIVDKIKDKLTTQRIATTDLMLLEKAKELLKKISVNNINTMKVLQGECMDLDKRISILQSGETTPKERGKTPQKERGKTPPEGFDYKKMF